ncbi:MAG: mechanosensitive ion channel [Pelagibacterales bacterium]|nr:mechanosensitive ion channel [Pelagibacterales bacterium]MDG1831179.1 mechanosensitive ion channel [Flavobacteriaceae bacterium]
MKKFIEFINKEFFITDDIKFSIVTILLVSLIFLITYLFLKLLKKIATKKLDEERKLKFKSVFSFLNYFVYIIVALITFQNFGINLTGIFAASAALLVGVGLALQTFFQDIISGILILADQTVHVGDIIEIDGKVGRVENIKIRTTRAVTFDNKVLIIPNHKYLTSTLFNWTENGTILRGSVSVGVSYDSDVEKVKEILLDIANSHPHLIKNPPPKVIFKNFGDSALDFKLIFTYNNGFRVNLIESDIRFLVHKKFKENNIEIPFPQAVVHLEK